MNRLFKFLRRFFNKVNSIFYIGATDILKEPLSREQEEYYVKLKEDGDMRAREKLIEHNLRLVVFLAKKYENTGVDLEDLVSIGNIGLIKGINTFSSDKNIKLATYCSRCIENEILMFLRKNKKLKMTAKECEEMIGNRHKEFIAKHPENRAAYLWMLDLLTADCRCAEAREYLDKMNALGRDFNSLLYLGIILEKENKRDEALAVWEKMTEEYSDDAKAWLVRGTESAKLCRYDEAIEFFKKYTELASHPQFVDAFESIAKIYEIRGEYEKAIESYEKMICILKEDWNETQGEGVDEPKRNIARLREKLAIK